MASPLAVMVYVANEEKNDLIVATSPNGVDWSFGKRLGPTTKAAPTLAVFGDQLLLVFIDDSDTLAYCTSTDGVNWSQPYPVTWFYDWGDLYYPPYDPNTTFMRGRVAGRSTTAPALVAYRTQSGDQPHLFYVPPRSNDELWYSFAKRRDRPHWDGPVGFEKSFPVQVWTRDPRGDILNRRRPTDLVDLNSPGRTAGVAMNGTFVMSYVYSSTLRLTSSTDAKVWTFPQVVAEKSGDPAMTVLNGKPVVAWRYNDGTNRLGVATIKDVGGPEEYPSVAAFGKIAELTNFGPAITSIGNTLVLVFVAAHERNHLLVCTSTDGVTWSSNHRIGQSSKMVPALATFYPKSS